MLGRPAVFADGAMVALAGEREAGLLALLVARRGTSTRAEVLEDELWDGRRVSDAALRVTVNRLRKRMKGDGDDLLRSEPRAYRLVADDGSIDACVYERSARSARDAHGAGRHAQAVDLAAQAELLWRGEAYDGFGHLASIRPERDRLENLRTATLELAAAAMVQLGRLDDSLVLISRVVSRQPHRESAHVLRSIALARAGRTNDAVRALSVFRSALAGELGARPGPAVLELEQQLLDGTAVAELVSPLLTVPTASPALTLTLGSAAAPRRAGPRRTGPGRTAPLLGREDELDRLAAAAAAASTGALQLVVVSGEAGIGKTSLLAEFADQRAEDWSVLWGRCDANQVVPLAAVLDALGPYISEHVPGPSAAVAGLLDGGATARSTTLAGDVRSHRTLEVLCDLVEDLALHRPLLLVLEDAQWADPLSLAFVERLLRDPVDRPVVVALTARTPDLPPSDLGRLLDTLGSSTTWTEIRVPPLDATRLVELTGIDAVDGLAEQVVGAAGGNPLFAEQLAAHLAAGRRRGDRDVGIPPSLDRLCRTRLAALEAPTLALVEIAAVMGEDCAAGDLAAVAGEPRAALGGRLNQLCDGRVLELTGALDHFRFCHGVMRQVAYDQIEPGRRAHLHLAVARAIGPVGGHRVGELALHLAEARPLVPDDEIADAALAAGRRAVELGDARIATHHFRTVMALAAPSPDRQMAAQFGMGVGLAASGDVVGASSSLDDAVASARDAGRWDVVADAAMARAALGIAATIPEAVDQAAVIDEVLVHLDRDDRRRRALLLCWKAEHLVNVAVHVVDATLEAATAEALLLDDPDVDDMIRYCRLRQADAACVGPDLLEQMAVRLVEHVDPARAPGLAARSLLVLQLARLRQGRIDAVRRTFAERPSWLSEAGPGTALQFELVAAGAAMASEPVDIADEQSAASAGHPCAGLEGLALAGRMMHLLVVRREQRRLHELEPLMLAALSMTPRRIFRPLVAAARDELHDAAGCAEQLASLFDELAGIGPDWAYLATLAFAAEIAAGTGARDMGTAIEERLDQHPPQVVVACAGLVVIGHIDRYKGLLAQLRGDLDVAVQRFASARSADSSSNMTLWAAWAAHGEASARLRRLDGDDESVAIRLLDQARPVADSHGSDRLRSALEHTRSLLTRPELG